MFDLKECNEFVSEYIAGHYTNTQIVKILEETALGFEEDIFHIQVFVEDTLFTGIVYNTVTGEYQFYTSLKYDEMLQRFSKQLEEEKIALVSVLVETFSDERTEFYNTIFYSNSKILILDDDETLKVELAAPHYSTIPLYGMEIQ